MTLQECQQLVKESGYKNFFSADWENDMHVYAFSVESIPGTYGHPAYTVHYQKFSGWLSETGKPARLVKDVAAENKKRELKNAKARAIRQAKAEAMRSIGMKRVRGNLGGTYWE